MKKYRYFLSIIIMFTAIWTLSTLAQVESSTPQVFKSIYNDTSPPLREIQEAPLSPTPWKNRIIPLLSRDAQFEDRYERDQSLQKIMGSRGTTSILQNWDGVPVDASYAVAPPDPNGDVGPNHYMEMVNLRFQIWNKTGTSLLGPLNLGTIWSGFPGPWSSSLNDGDPIVLYDETAGRWFAAQFSLPNYPSGPCYILIAVSTTGDPTGSWYRYGFTFTNMPDYPKFGVWPDGYYMSANTFVNASSFIGASATAFNRTQMLAGNPATMVFFQNSAATTWSLLPSDWNGTTTPPAGAPNYFGQQHDNADYGGTDGFDIYQFHVDWVTPANSTFTGPTFLATNAFVKVNGIPQLGTSQLLDDLSVMTMNRLDYRNFGTHQSMVVCHTVDAGSGRAGMRWYEFRKSGGGWSIYQQGTYAPADGLYRWMGSIAINAGGDIALGYSVSSSSIYPAIRYTGRLSSDTPGVMTIPEETIQAGLGSQTGGLERWGDYTQMVVDPNGETFWYVNQYQPSTGSYNWKTRIASMEFGPPCPVGAPSNPNPGNGVTNVSINLPQISWTNGAGATLCEVWFGGTGNMTKVYDGSLISSWTIPAPLNYNTIYNWQIVDKNSTCGVSGSIWAFTTMQDPNLVVDTVKVYPQNLNYWTGTCNSSTKTDVSEVRGRNTEDGWLVFNVSGLPLSSIVNSIKFYGYVNATNYPWWSLTPMGTIDPRTAPASQIKAYVEANSGQGTAYVYADESSSFTTGWHNWSLGSQALQNLQNAIPQGWFACGMDSRDNSATYYIEFDGWAQANKPYLEVVYEYINVADPTNVTPTPISYSQIDIGFTPNASNNNVVIVWNLTGTFNVPSGSPPAIGQSFVGGTLLYNGITSPVNHIGLNQLTTYYYKLFSFNGTDYSPGIGVNATTLATPTTFPLSVTITDGWNMVSIPGLHPTNQNVSTWWPGLTGTVWGFNGVQYVSKTIATPGEGYWMKHVGATVYNYPAIQIVPNTPLNALSGWNMIGGYENSVATIGLVTSPPNQITGTIWGYNGVQYVAANTLVPGYSYWVKLLPGCPCTITIPEALSKGTEAVEYFKADWGRIVLTDATGLSYTLYAVKGEVDLDQYEMPPMPPAGMFDIRFSSGRIAEDINSSIQTIDMSGITYPLTVRVENMDIKLQDVTGKQINLNLKSGEEIVINDATINKLMVSGELIPDKYALEQNYPNPFNPSTVIEFSLPEDVGNVKLSIYNTLGERIAELVNASLTAGKYSYQWNARNVATGMYIYELRTGKFVAVKKMILLR